MMLRTLTQTVFFTVIASVIHAQVPTPLDLFAEEFVVITPGQGVFPSEFDMGADDEPASRPASHTTLQATFEIAKYEVPQNLYQQIMGANPSRWKGERNSVEMLTPQDAREFCRRVTHELRQKKLLSDAEEIRLPTEIEWEYCCRAGTTTRYCFGNEAQAASDVGKQASLLDKYAWHAGNAAGNDPPVGALTPNAWGLYDMHGYLWELCSDSWRSDYAETSQPADDGSVVMRGGSWKNEHPALSSASRQRFSADGRDDAVGFRCVKSRLRDKP